MSNYIYENESDYNALLEGEWGGFLNGTYGMCTKDSSPEQIATQNFTIRVIDRITDKQQKTQFPMWTKRN